MTGIECSHDRRDSLAGEEDKAQEITSRGDEGMLEDFDVLADRRHWGKRRNETRRSSPKPRSHARVWVEFARNRRTVLGAGLVSQSLLLIREEGSDLRNAVDTGSWGVPGVFLGCSWGVTHIS